MHIYIYTYVLFCFPPHASRKLRIPVSLRAACRSAGRGPGPFAGRVLEAILAWVDELIDVGLPVRKDLLQAIPDEGSRVPPELLPTESTALL